MAEYGQLKISLVEAGSEVPIPGAAVEVSSECFAQDIMISIQDTDVFYSDNGFCLDAGGTITVSVRQEKEGLKGKRMRIVAHNSAPVTVIL